MKKILIALVGVVVTSSVMAMPPAPSQVLLPVVNDGYLIVSQAKPNGPHVMVCPPGKAWLRGEYDRRDANPACSDDDGGSSKAGTAVTPVTPQIAADMAFGVGVATVVGVAPLVGIWGETVIYYRLKQKP